MVEQDEKEQSRLKTKKNSEIIAHTLPPYLKLQEEQLVARFMKHNGNPFSKLHSLYEFMEELFEFVQKFSPCKKGCSHCCHIEVSISEQWRLNISGGTRASSLLKQYLSGTLTGALALS